MKMIGKIAHSTATTDFWEYPVISKGSL